MARPRSCGAFLRVALKSGFVLMWILVFVAAIVCHVGIARLHNVVQDIPATFISAYEHILGFSSIASDALHVQLASKNALALCGASPSDCFDLKSSPGTSHTSAEKSTIEQSFHSSLESVRKMAMESDASRDLRSMGFSLNLILEDLNSFSVTGAACDVSNKAYCRIYTAAGIVGSIAPAVCADFEQGLSNPSMIQRWHGNWGVLHLLHLLPAVPVFCMATLSFICYYKLRGASGCCGGRILMCSMAFAHVTLWLVTLVISSTVAVGGLILRSLVSSGIIHDVFKDDPSVSELLSHLGKTDPELCDILFENLFNGLKTFMIGFVLFEILCAVIPIFDTVFLVYGPSLAKSVSDKKKAGTAKGQPALDTGFGTGSDSRLEDFPYPGSRRSRSKNGYATVVVL